MAFKPFCNSCGTWHWDNEPHQGLPLSIKEALTLLNLIDRLNLTLTEPEAMIYSRLSLFAFQNSPTRSRGNPIEGAFARECERDIEEDDRGDFR